MKKKSTLQLSVHLKIGDKVQVISGKDKGKIGRVIKILKKRNGVIIEGVNVGVKHIKPSGPGENGEIKTLEFPIHISNVAFYEE